MVIDRRLRTGAGLDARFTGHERAEERHVGLVERLADKELPSPFVDGPAGGGDHRRGVGAQAIDVLPCLLPVPNVRPQPIRQATTPAPATGGGAPSPPSCSSAPATANASGS